MKPILFATSILLFCSCTNESHKDCNGKLLDLTIASFDDPSNKIISNAKSSAFTNIEDSLTLIKYEPVNRVQYFFQPSKLDSTKRKFVFKVKPGIIRTPVYDVDLILIKDNDEKGENAFYSLNSYDRNRVLLGHVDLAHWSRERNSYVSGRIDCDSSIHMILNRENEQRIFRLEKSGEIKFIEKRKID